ncbi:MULTISPECIES: carbohydrate ABC transporter permease [Microbacterium]|uniref:carbohydrate ABC transporter permease n=1 Tax=Microbacterium TaxID=33882 RepID=UPI001E45216A|nr:sugar ABC transporter permease [Microbacterium nymphoidis]MCD2497666.1 sugar ABC transporter permease [Microbacterium nymphoidis]
MAEITAKRHRRRSAPEPDPRTRARKRREARNAWALLAPAIVLLGVMVGYPGVTMVTNSFTDFSIKNKMLDTPANFVGLDNYIKVLTASDFPIVLVRSLLLMAVMTALIMVMGTLIAVLMTRLSRGFRTLVAVGLLLAWAMPPLSSTVVFSWIFDTQYGVINAALNAITGTTAFTNHSWLMNPFSFFTVLTFIVVWMGIPFVAFTVYAALGQVPGEVLEAAALDGASGLNRFRLVVFPYLRSVMMVVFILQVIWNLRIFTQVFALQGRGGTPSETNVLGTYMFRLGADDFGMTGAIGVLMVIILMAISFGYIRSTLKEEEK